MAPPDVSWRRVWEKTHARRQRSRMPSFFVKQDIRSYHRKEILVNKKF
jgi:hypothetical protein